MDLYPVRICVVEQLCSGGDIGTKLRIYFGDAAADRCANREEAPVPGNPGGSDRSLFITMPGGLPFVYQNQRIGWGYRSGPEPHLHGKLIDEKAGTESGRITICDTAIEAKNIERIS